jgi:phage gp36-like protein
MPFYVSAAGIIERYGQEAVVFAADADNTGLPDTLALTRAIQDAEAEVDSYIGVVYDLPLPDVTDIPAPDSNVAVPAVLRRIVTDIAIYRMATEHDRLTEEKRQRSVDALAWLKMVAGGQISLGVETSVPAVGGSGAIRYGEERLFTRAKTRGLF